MYVQYVHIHILYNLTMKLALEFPGTWDIGIHLYGGLMMYEINKTFFFPLVCQNMQDIICHTLL